MLPKTRHGVRRLRSGALTLAVAAFVPLAIPATASASVIPGHTGTTGFTGPGSYFISPLGYGLVNEANAFSFVNQKTVFNMKFGLGVGVSPYVNAVNRAVARTSRCENCNAVAIAFQVVTTTEQDLVSINAENVATATNYSCVLTCDAEANAYQVVVATDTPQPMPFGQLLSSPRMSALDNLRTEFYALQNSGLSLAQIQAKCQDLVNQAVTILQNASYAGPSGPSSSDPPPIRPTVSAALQGGGTDTELPVVDVYHTFQFRPFSGG